MPKIHTRTHQILNRLGDWGDHISIMYIMQIREMLDETIIKANQTLGPGPDLYKRVEQLIEKEVTPYALELYNNFMENQRKQLDSNIFFINKEQPFSKTTSKFFNKIFEQHTKDFPFSTTNHFVYIPNFDSRSYEIIGLEPSIEDKIDWRE